MLVFTYWHKPIRLKGKQVATIADLEFAAMWLECYEAGDDKEISDKVKRAIEFLDKEINKRQARKGK